MYNKQNAADLVCNPGPNLDKSEAEESLNAANGNDGSTECDICWITYRNRLGHMLLGERMRPDGKQVKLIKRARERHMMSGG